MDAQEILAVLAALAASVFLVRKWIVSAKEGKCSGCDSCSSKKCPSKDNL